MQSFRLTTGTPTRLATAPQRASLLTNTKGSVCKAIMAPSASDVVLDQAAGRWLFKLAAAVGNPPANPPRLVDCRELLLCLLNPSHYFLP
jgi:hypothetical protein